MPKYMLLIYTAGERPPPDARGEQWPAWLRYTESLREAGVLHHGAPLDGVETATTVRGREREQVVVDGPFAETKEFLAGYYLIECADLQTAVEHAKTMPNLAYGSTEVRPVVEQGIASAEAPEQTRA